MTSTVSKPSLGRPSLAHHRGNKSAGGRRVGEVRDLVAETGHARHPTSLKHCVQDAVVDGCSHRHRNARGPASKRLAMALLPLVDEPVADEVDAPVPELATALERAATLEDAADAELAVAAVVVPKVEPVPRS